MGRSFSFNSPHCHHIGTNQAHAAGFVARRLPRFSADPTVLKAGPPPRTSACVPAFLRKTTSPRGLGRKTAPSENRFPLPQRGYRPHHRHCMPGSPAQSIRPLALRAITARCGGPRAHAFSVLRRRYDSAKAPNARSFAVTSHADYGNIRANTDVRPFDSRLRAPICLATLWCEVNWVRSRPVADPCSGQECSTTDSGSGKPIGSQQPPAPPDAACRLAERHSSHSAPTQAPQ